VGNDIPLWQTWVTYSTDEGATWPVPPKPLVDGDQGGRGCVKNKPLLLDGAIICGASTEVRNRLFFVRVTRESSFVACAALGASSGSPPFMAITTTGYPARRNASRCRASWLDGCAWTERPVAALRHCHVFQLVTVPVLTALADEDSHQEEGWHAFVDVSEDGGETFTRSPNVAMPEHVGVIQPTLWESNVGVHMMLRSNAGHIYRADSVRASLSAVIGELLLYRCPAG
jgi:hypothetical protein